MGAIGWHIRTRSAASIAATLTILGCAMPPSPSRAAERAAPAQPATPAQPGEAALGLDASRALVGAEPAGWPAAAQRVLTLGPEAATALARAIREAPAAPGEQIAIAVLGELGGEVADALLLELLAVPDVRSAAEAALALHRAAAEASPDAAVVTALRRIVGDPTADPLLRTSAAASLLRAGRREDAVPLLHAVLIADTPDARAVRDRFGLPNRPRWALERTIAIDAIRAVLADDFGLHPDLAWPDLVDRAARFRAAALPPGSDG